MNGFSVCAENTNTESMLVYESAADDMRVANRDYQFPAWLLFITVFLCFVPLLNIWGFSLESAKDHFDVHQISQWNLPETQIIDEMYYSLRGDMHHALVECSAVVVAFVCIIMAFAHYNISRDITAPILGVALVVSGSMDIVHTLAATRVIDAIAENNDLIPFTWAVSRSFNAVVLLFGVGIILLSKKKRLSIGLTEIAFSSLLLAVLVYVTATWMAESEYLPQTQFPDSWITRPYDVLPMILFLICLPLYGLLYKQNSNYLTFAIMIGLLPDIFSEAYMAFGSEQLFDHYFNSAHGLKLVSYTLPLLGYMLDYTSIFRKRDQEQKLLMEMNTSLTDSESRIRSINELLPVGLLIVNEQGNIIDTNKYALNLFDYTEVDLVGESVEKLVPDTIKMQHISLRENFQKSPNARQMAGKVDFLKGKKRNGDEVSLEINLGPIVLDNQQHTLVSLLDISDKKKLVDDLIQSNHQMDKAIVKLTHSNEQLERFAFVCSHDLQEPVRMVESFSQLLEERCKEQLQGKGLEYLGYITDGAHRSREMISDILTFCRLDQSTNALEKVSLTDVCHQVHKTLEVSLKQKNGEFTWQGPLPTLDAVPTQIFQLILNLVNNGLKFNRCEKPQVQLSAINDSGRWLILLKDNGIGINKKYQKQIFKIFERLNSKSEFSGTGMGLAICKKIAEQNGAELKIDSDEGKGSTFILDWPKQYQPEDSELSVS